jgi:PAT family beta-lactamase induction signal transducer AmpG
MPWIITVQSPDMPAAAAKLTTWQSLAAIFRSRRLLSVALLSFSSGLPLGIVWITVPAWLAQGGVNIGVIGLFTLAQAPWSFKLLWAPLMDRHSPPFLGRRRGYILLSQLALFALGLVLALAAYHPERLVTIGLVCMAIAFVSATHDIAYDAYAVDVLQPDEHGAAAGARLALYRGAMILSGGATITLAAWWSWPAVFALFAFSNLPLLYITWTAPEPADVPKAPPSLREAVWEPFLGFMQQHRALEILAFVVLYKLSDNLTQALTRPFLIQMGYNAVDVGIATATVTTAAVIAGGFLGGVLTGTMGLGRALWVFGFLQIVSNVGYALVAAYGINRPLMYSALAFELGTTGLGSGAFGVLLLRLTQKRFSATQYALLSSLFTIPRILAGPPAGLMADAMGWRDFFLSTMFFGLPGLYMLSRFVPWGARDPQFSVAAPSRKPPLSRAGLAARAAFVGLVTLAFAVFTTALLDGIRSMRAGRGFHLPAQLGAILQPATVSAWLTLGGLAVLAAGTALTAAAAIHARRGGGGAPVV